MESFVKEITSTKKEIKIIVPFEDIKKFIAQTEKEIVQNFEMKGFRKGQVPKEIVLKEIGQEKILSQAAPIAVEEFYLQAIKNNSLEPLGSPEIEILKLAFNNPLEFKAIISILPEIKLSDYRKVAQKVKKQEVIIKDEEVEEAIKQLQDVKDKMPKEQQEKISFGKGEELKTTIRAQIKKEKETTEKQRVRDEILNEISKDCSFSVPEVLTLREKERAMEELKRNVTNFLKISFEDYLKKNKKSEKELEDSLKPKIIEKIKKILILREIQKLEKIDAEEDEVEKEVKMFLEHPANEKTKQEIDQVALKSYLKERIEQEKTLQFLENLIK